MTFFRPALLLLACLLSPPVLASDLPSLGDSSSAIVSPEKEHQLGRAWLSILRVQVRLSLASSMTGALSLLFSPARS